MLLHLLALVPAAIGVCCLALDRRPARAGELVAGVAMLAAMIDAAVTGLVAAVWWAALLVAGALALSAVRGRRRSAAAAMPGAAAMTMHAATGMIAMAALMIGMPAAGALEVAGHSHGHGAPAIGTAGALLGASYVVASAVLAARTRVALDRAQYGAMAASVGLMSLALVA
ncbi:hypothetical protein [Microbacterium sp. No. 7]|uniref:hypothetical protein n=1 Tax=Microbacterium sp. No. 7 TaxID=1714373 RepID=UPI0006CF6406|nr:hypothetical protein [Microbacterium sp. No. 7]ALJ19456.1 hypothetical protein AOA12_05860 [Microbacterium sp. No. 7]